tara:strand:+ start:579 stop:740 length:162 start_codon:yes stop_codon:yes gene_type:complete
MNYHNLIIWEKQENKEQGQPYVQIPLPIPSLPQEKPLNSEKDKEKRGVYIFEM